MSTYLVRNKVLNNRKLLRTSKKPQKDIFMANLTKIGEVLPLLNLEANELWLNRYYKFISERNRDSKPSDQLYERHHVLPRCLFSEETTFMDSTENLTYLTLREHFVAHLILTKVFPETGKLKIAAFMMGSRSGIQNSRTYLTLMRETRRELSILSIKQWKNPECREFQAELAKARWKDPYYRVRMKAIHTSTSHRDNISKRMTEKWKEPEYRNLKTEQRHELNKSATYIENLSKSATERWVDPYFREKMDGITNSEEHKEKMKKASKETWENDSFKAKHKESMNTLEVKEKISLASKNNWEKPGVKEKASERMTKIFEDPELRKIYSERTKLQWEDPSFREIRSNAVKAQWRDSNAIKKASERAKIQFSSPEARSKLSSTTKLQWADPVYRAKQALSRAKNKASKNPLDGDLALVVELRQEELRVLLGA